MRTETIEALHLIPPPALAAAAAALRAAVPGIGIAVEYPDGHAADPVVPGAQLGRELVPAAAAPTLSCSRGRRPSCSAGTSATAATTCSRWRCPALDGLVSVTHSNSKGLIEAGALGVSKASVVAEIAAAHGIGRESVIAFGDMPNDLPLLAWAGTSCAVANAHPAVLAAATHVIGSNDEDGVAEYLEKLYP